MRPIYLWKLYDRVKLKCDYPAFTLCVALSFPFAFCSQPLWKNDDKLTTPLPLSSHFSGPFYHGPQFVECGVLNFIWEQNALISTTSSQLWVP